MHNSPEGNEIRCRHNACPIWMMDLFPASMTQNIDVLILEGQGTEK